MTIFSKRYANDSCHAILMNGGLTVQMREHERLGFTLEEYKRRYEHVLANMKDEGVDVLAIRSPENICYLTGHETPGYYGYHCLLVSAHDEPVLIVRRIEEINAPEFSWLTRTVPVEDYQHPFEFVIEELRRIGAGDKRIGVEKGMGHDRRCHEKRGFMFTVAEYEALTTALPKATFVDSEGIVENARLIKSDAEVEMMRRAARIADKALLAGIEATEVGVTENDVAAAVYYEWCKNGAEYTGLPNFILSGSRQAICHATWRGRRIEPGDPMFFEIAASKFRYCGAILRIAYVGEPPKRILEMDKVAREAFELAMSIIKPGVSCEAVDKACNDLLSKHGYGANHIMRSAYSLGLNFPPDWGEGHILSIQPGESRLLERNMTFHLLPSCCAPGDLEMTYSGTVRVTENGCEVLNEVPLNLNIV